MASSLTGIRDILLPGLKASPEEREKAKQAADVVMARKMAEERAYYASLTPAQQAEYDALTEGMMPRLRRR